MNIICNYRTSSFIKKTIKNDQVKSYIISLANYSLFTENAYSVEEVLDIITYLKKHQKTVIIDVAKIVHEDELVDLEEKIILLSNGQADYFMYSDFGVHYILNKNGLGNKTMLYSNTYLTNTLDTKIYQEKNQMVVLSNQVNAEELIKISNDSYKNQIVSGFGLALIMYTYRPLLTNYFSYRGQDHNPKKSNYSLQEEFRDDLYPIVESENSTKIYDYGYYYLFDELKQLSNDVDVIVSGELLSDKQYLEVINLYATFISSNVLEEECLNTLMNLNIKVNKGAYSRKLTLTKGGN